MIYVICLSWASWENHSSYALPDTQQAEGSLYKNALLAQMLIASPTLSPVQYSIMKDADSRLETQSKAVGEGCGTSLPSPLCCPAGPSTYSATKSESLSIWGFEGDLIMETVSMKPMLVVANSLSSPSALCSTSLLSDFLGGIYQWHTEPRSSTHKLLGAHSH